MPYKGVFAHFLCLILSLCLQQSSHAWNEKEITDLITEIRGDDKRLVRWSASEHTAKYQEVAEEEGDKKDGVSCGVLPELLGVLSDKSAKDTLKGMVCEFATFCVTDNPHHRSVLSDIENVHSDVVQLVTSSDSHASAKAAHLVYIAAFDNEKNHQGFHKAGAIKALGDIVKDYNIIKEDKKESKKFNKKSKRKVSSAQTMWAAAAIQNLAASYCDTEDDGRCYWGWYVDLEDITIRKESLPLVSDGIEIRKELSEDKELVKRLVELTCMGPIVGKMDENNVYPGFNAEDGTHDQSPQIIPWAAAGALKNLALLPEAKKQIEQGLPCLCRMQNSADWLEENKAQGAVYHLRRGDPCWFGDDGEDYPNGDLCIDENSDFRDDEGYLCTDYGTATELECSKPNEDGERPDQHCCACGAGVRDHKLYHTEL